MSIQKTLALLLIAGAGIGACTPKEQPSQSDAAAMTHPSSTAQNSVAGMGSGMASAMASGAPSAAPATAANDPLPSHSDVAKKVRGEITKQNYKAELDKLEKEIE